MALLAVICSLTAATGAHAASTLPTVSLAITPTSITASGALQSGGVNVVTTATGTKEANAALILLKPGVSVAEIYAFLSTDKASMDPNTASKFGSIVFDGETPVGKSEAQTTLAPGQYVAINAEGEKSSKWPRTSFTVGTASSPATLPTPQAVVRTIEFAFRGASTLHDGDVVGFLNEGYVVHMTLGFPVKSKAAGEKLSNALLKGKEKQAEKLVAGQPVGFAGPLSTGGYQQETITAKPGWYVLACFMDTQDHRDHTTLGMERIIKIVK